jgi:signal transduction histidine kinase
LPGYTTKKRGWGLGLSLSKRIIEKYHAGRIYVKESSPGKGTTFAIEIPSTI